MRKIGRSRLPDHRSPGIARFVFDSTVQDVRAVRRLLKRIARHFAHAIIVDISALSTVSSSVWAAVVAGVRDLSYVYLDVTVRAHPSQRSLLEISNVGRQCRLMFT